MPFDRDLAKEILESGDRDVARFFAGREAEIRAFETAVRSAGTKRQAEFRIFQGPPGCGKTSLAHHLAETRADKVLFVSCEPDDLSDAATLSNRIERAAIERGGAIARAAATAAETAGERLGARPLADAALRAVAGFSSRDATTIVLHLDEAHARVSTVGERLVSLHTSGVGVPCVVLLTGLGHTSLRVSAVRGLSRLADKAVVDMGAMKESECAASIEKMLAALDVSGPRTRATFARQTAKLAHGWPQHLHCVQTALCEELIRTDGALLDVDTGHLRARSDELRHRYYARRLEDPIFQIDTSLTKRVLVDVARARLSSDSRIQLRKLCEATIDHAGLSDEPEFRDLPPGTLSEALIGRGLVSGTSAKWEVAIPSMADWAAREIGVEPPRREDGAGLAR